MSKSQLKGEQILDGSIKKDDLNITETGKAVIIKVKAGNNISLDSTGVDAGTGEVTIHSEKEDLLPGANSFNKLVTAKTKYIDDGNSAWDDYYIGGEGSLDTTDFVTGTGSVKITTQTRSAYNGISKDINSSPATITGKDITLWVKSSDWSKVNQANLILSEDYYTLSKTYTIDLKTRLQNPPNDEWIEIIVPKSAFVADGSPTWSTINLMLFRIKDNGTQADISLDSISTFNKGSESKISITFDDGYDDVYVEGRKKLDEYGYKATAYIISSLIGNTGYLTQEQVDKLHLSGWDISGHGNSNLTTLTETQLDADLRAMKKYLNAHGYRGSDQYAYPNGAWSEDVNKYVRKYFGTATNIDGWNNSTSKLSPYRINRQSIDKWTTTTMVQAWIDNAIANDEWLILNFHTLVTTEVDGQDWTITKFGTIVDYLNTVNANVQTVSSVLK